METTSTGYSVLKLAEHSLRHLEFAERGPLPRRRLVLALRSAVLDACRVLQNLPARQLSSAYRIQKLRVTGLNAVLHVVEHFAFHTGQIIFITKQVQARDLGFTRLPGERRRVRARATKLPVL